MSEEKETHTGSLLYFMPHWLFELEEISNTTKMAYALLSGLSHTNEEKECFPSDEYIGKRLKISRQQANGCVQDLKKIGAISTRNTAHPNAFKKRRYIKVHMELKKCLRCQENTTTESKENTTHESQENTTYSNKEYSNKESTLKGTKESARKSRAPHVSSSFSEHENLVKDYGEELVQRAYEKLSEWKIDTPKSKWKKNDHLAIRRWVIEALREEDIKAEKASRRPENAIKEVQGYLKSHSRKEGLKRALKSKKVEIGPHWIDFKEFPRDGYIDFTSKNAKVLIDHFINKMNL